MIVSIDYKRKMVKGCCKAKDFKDDLLTAFTLLGVR